MPRLLFHITAAFGLSDDGEGIHPAVVSTCSLAWQDIHVDRADFIFPIFVETPCPTHNPSCLCDKVYNQKYVVL